MASNHGNGDGPDFDSLKAFKQALKEMPIFGATGKFPDGQVTEDDEGELQFGIANGNGHVIVNFGKPVAWLSMRPDQALLLSAALAEHAAQARIIGGNRAERRLKAAKSRALAEKET